MPLDHLKLPIPERCPQCAAAGTIQLQQTIRGQAVLLNWLCQRCNAELPITPRDDEHDTSRAIPRKAY